MADQAYRPRLTEEEPAGRGIRKTAGKAGKAAGRAETRQGKPPDRLRPERQSSRAVKGKLRLEAGARRPPAVRRASASAATAALNTARNTVRDAVGRPDNDGADSSGADALRAGEAAARKAGSVMESRRYGRRLKQHDKAGKLGRRPDRKGTLQSRKTLRGEEEQGSERSFRRRAKTKVSGLCDDEVGALYQRERSSPGASSNPLSKWRQKQELKKRYMEARSGGKAGASGAAKGGKKAAEKAGAAADKMMAMAKEHPQAVLTIGAFALLVMLIAGMFSSCAVMFAGSGDTVLGTSYTAEDADILGADADYTALEAALDSRISRIETENPGYDEYRYDLAQTGHNPYELASCLTVLFEGYTRAEAQAALQSLFARQYALTLTPEVEIRTRMETRTGTATGIDPETGETVTTTYTYEEEVEYEYRILNVRLANRGLGAAVLDLGLAEGQMERYGVLMMTSGNRPELFGEDVYGVPGGAYTDYDIPGEALTDERFRRMITEAERYLGYPYVWGGSSPSTSFDCSGFVSWVINHSGNGWDVGRLTANGLMGICSIIPKSGLRPGDLVFFQGTYATSGASHVGIYAGDGMMIHAGSPISYSSIETPYWEAHWYCGGRLP